VRPSADVVNIILARKNIFTVNGTSQNSPQRSLQTTNSSKMASSQPDLENWTPSPLFFYGSLMDSDMLCHIASPESTPILSTASIKRLKTKLWGLCPAIVPTSHNEDVVCDKMWVCKEKKQFQALECFEGPTYTVCPVEMVLEDETKIRGWSFCWKGDAQSCELEDGEFDMQMWKERYKPNFHSQD
jgi:gamma-glutamylcyclotransferase (GGCT)/AIG2-like uncharacterized protein YtfP